MFPRRVNHERLDNFVCSRRIKVDLWKLLIEETNNGGLLISKIAGHSTLNTLYLMYFTNMISLHNLVWFHYDVTIERSLGVKIAMNDGKTLS